VLFFFFFVHIPVPAGAQEWRNRRQKVGIDQQPEAGFPRRQKGLVGGGGGGGGVGGGIVWGGGGGGGGGWPTT